MLAIGPHTRSVEVRDADGSMSRHEYDDLVIATGAEPIRPPLPGIDADGIHGVRPEVLEKAQQVVGEKYGNYSGVLKIDGDVGNKKLYDPRRLTPRSWPRGSVCTRLVTDSLHQTRRRAYLPDVLHS